MAQLNFRILHVEDEEAFRLQVRELLLSEGYDVDTINDGVEAINSLKKNVYDIALLDISMPKVDGIEVLHFIKEKYSSTEVIMLSGVNNVKIAVDCMKEGAFNYVTKPFQSEELLQIIARAIEHRELLRQNTLMRTELSRLSESTELIGQSQTFRNVLAMAERVAQSDTSVLIQGSSGTGKELIADFIYKKSERANYPFVAINCAAIPDTLLESELFGHEKGAFTDARSQKQGLIELANRGTLFLDEVGDISLFIQPKLLRFLQTGEFRRIGSNTVLKADLRIISATNKDLRAEVANGRFREDLLYRLNVITLAVPPLRDRKEDIPLLIANFINRKMRTKAKKQVSPEAVSLLQNYDWPGNVRELENVLESATILSKGDVIEIQDIMLPRFVHSHYNISGNEPNIIGSPVSLKETERLHIAGVLETLKWDKKEASKVLGISLKTLYTKIAHYNLEEK